MPVHSRKTPPRSPSAPIAEKMVSEVLPLLEAVRFLEKNAARILQAKRYGRRGRPLWLGGHSFEVERKPFGVVLIVGPGNYPLFIPAVQMLQALAAGNAVVVKPAPSCTRVIESFADLLRETLPPGLIQILPEEPAAARAAVRAGIDKAIFTGASENGRAFLAELAHTNTPSVMELSGADAVFVRADADATMAAKAIAFGQRLNAGDTCMAPRTIIAHRTIAPELTAQLQRLGLATDGIFVVEDDAEALEIAAFDEHGLGASIFSRDEDAARAFARQLATGFATINDLIVPTADPRFPFGGVRASGFGVSRGAEGLLEMTYPQAIAVRRSRFLPHLDAPKPGDEKIFEAFIHGAHGKGFGFRTKSLLRLLSLIRKRK